MLPSSLSVADISGAPVDQLRKLSVDGQDAGPPQDHALVPQTPRDTTHPLTMATPSSTVTPSIPARFSSPTLASFLMTPSSSTQVHSKSGLTTQTSNGHMERGLPLRTPTPSTALLSSPPPTAERFTIPVPKTTDQPALTSPTANQIAEASPTELRTYLDEMKSEVERLSTALTSARTTAAHHKLQYTLLRIESDETAKRMAVEHEMTRREVEVLRRAELGHRQLQRMHELEAGPRPARELSKMATALRQLKEEAKELRNENEVLRRRLQRAKKLIRFRDGEVWTLELEGERLRQRIRENREHINYFRRSLGVYDGQTPQILDSPIATPHRPQAPRSGGEPRSATSGPTRAGGGPDTFAALLLADQVLSQGNAQAPSTVGRTRTSRPGNAGHSRATQSLSSLPPVFLEVAFAPPEGTPRSILSKEPATLLRPVVHPGSQERRRSSRDSTISASDRERSPEMHRSQTSKRGRVVQESEASQLAAHMLRRPPPPTPESGPARRSTQLKLQGQVKKPSVAQRSTDKTSKRPLAVGAEKLGFTFQLPPSKRVKTGPGVGLGIGS